MDKAWIFFDGRADLGRDTFDCAVLEACHSRREVHAAIQHWRKHDAVLFEYDCIGGQLENERRVGHVNEGPTLLDRCTPAPQEDDA